jgi:hypothetical protein
LRVLKVCMLVWIDGWMGMVNEELLHYVSLSLIYGDVFIGSPPPEVPLASAAAVVAK